MGEMILDYLGGLNLVPGALKSGKGKQRSGLESHAVKAMALSKEKGSCESKECSL